MSERERKKKNGGGANCISGFGSGSLDISTRKMTNSGRNHHRFDVSNRAGLRSDRKVSPLSCFWGFLRCTMSFQNFDRFSSILYLGYI